MFTPPAFNFGVHRSLLSFLASFPHEPRNNEKQYGLQSKKWRTFVRTQSAFCKRENDIELQGLNHAGCRSQRLNFQSKLIINKQHQEIRKCSSLPGWEDSTPTRSDPTVTPASEHQQQSSEPQECNPIEPQFKSEVELKSKSMCFPPLIVVLAACSSGNMRLDYSVAPRLRY